ncbi:hypothetical protein GGS20DRAFT_425516 [Poronia punctata]|nr:hypothetical protein GGS20DRAFT_425516 [Poronia punctata]
MPQMFRTTEKYTIITPFPSYITRQLAIEILHTHGEVIKLNPLVLDYKQVDAPRDAPADEYFSTWYEISERVQFVPGMGRLGSGKISFKACFHDLPWGLQTHVYAPLSIDMLNRYYIGGSRPGEENPPPPEVGLTGPGIPREGLYLKEDIEIRCNITMMGTVKKQMKKASEMMVARIITMAGLPPAQSPMTPQFASRPMSMRHQPPSRPPTSGSQGYPSHWQAQQEQQQQQQQQWSAADDNKMSFAPVELSSEPPASAPPGTTEFPMELPGDFYHPHAPQRPESSISSLRQSLTPDPSGQMLSPQLSPSMKSSRPSSYSSDHGSAGYASPALDYKGFAAELPTHRETTEEHGAQTKHHSHGYVAYNPADYAANANRASVPTNGNVR